jgi:hypothetical protein
MTQTTPMNTVAAGTITTMVASCLMYSAGQAHITLPPDVAGSMAVLIVGGMHWLGQTVPALIGAIASRGTKAPVTAASQS